MTSSSVKRSEILKGWVEHKGFEYFLEDMEKVKDASLSELRHLDLISETEQGREDRATACKKQATIIAINTLIQTMSRYNTTSQVVSDESKNLT